MKEFKVGNELHLEVYAEICCDECYEIVHNHIDCPVCKKDYSSTDQYTDLRDETQLTCENCKTTFEKVSELWYDDCKVKIIKIEQLNNPVIGITATFPDGRQIEFKAQDCSEFITKKPE